MLRRPPRSTLFPYNDALPISQRRAESGPEYEEEQEWLGERCDQSPPVAPVAKDVAVPDDVDRAQRSEEHTSELQSQFHLVCRLLLEKKKTTSKRLYILASAIL